MIVMPCSRSAVAPSVSPASSRAIARAPAHALPSMSGSSGATATASRDETLHLVAVARQCVDLGEEHEPQRPQPVEPDALAQRHRRAGPLRGRLQLEAEDEGGGQVDVDHRAGAEGAQRTRRRGGPRPVAPSRRGRTCRWCRARAAPASATAGGERPAPWPARPRRRRGRRRGRGCGRPGRAARGHGIAPPGAAGRRARARLRGGRRRRRRRRWRSRPEGDRPER